MELSSRAPAPQTRDPAAQSQHQNIPPSPNSQQNLEKYVSVSDMNVTKDMRRSPSLVSLQAKILSFNCCIFIYSSSIKNAAEISKVVKGKSEFPVPHNKASGILPFPKNMIIN
jgi:hypothetical protein